MLVGLEAMGQLVGVLLLGAEGEEEEGCSWLTGSWCPTCWTSCLLEEGELLGALEEERQETIRHETGNMIKYQINNSQKS